MARKKQTDRREKAKWSGYVNFYPTEEERKAIKAVVHSPADFERFVADMVDEGYRVSYRFDDYRGVPVLELYGLFADSPNPGKALVVPHADLLVASTAAAFFITEYSESKGKWPETTNAGHDW